jgi:hypothetical protein
MAEARAITFSYKEVVEALLKQEGIHDGIWALSVEFGFGAANINTDPSGETVAPASIVTVQKIGLVRAEKLDNISVDAAEVNPAPKTTAKQTKK